MAVETRNVPAEGVSHQGQACGVDIRDGPQEGQGGQDVVELLRLHQRVLELLAAGTTVRLLLGGEPVLHERSDVGRRTLPPTEGIEEGVSPPGEERG